jgi:PilZ domain
MGAGQKVVPSVKHSNSPSRRMTSRIAVPEDTWVYWHCKGGEDISRIRDLSPVGLFIETPREFPANTETKLHFLVQEGGISAQAVVRHARPGTGLGLKFVSLREEHRRQLVALINRLRGALSFGDTPQ